MIHFHTGSQAVKLATILSVAGEFPMHSIHMLGNERVFKILIHKLTAPQTFRNPQTNEELTCRLLSVSGRASDKTIRLYKAAIPILRWIGADEYYLRSFWGHRFPGDAAHRERNHRVAEAVAMCMNAGFEYRPCVLPVLQNLEMRSVIREDPVFYPAKYLKQVGEIEMNKTMFTRMVGAVFASGVCYAVYNTRNAAMKWGGMGEFKALHGLIEISRLNADITQVDSAILFGESDAVALNTLLETNKSHRLELRFDSVYRHIRFIPMDAYGTRLLRLFTVPDWNEKILELLFEPEHRSYDRGQFEYDACIEGTYILSYLDGDIARLIRFKEAIINQSGTFEVLCYPRQVPFLSTYLNGLAGIKTIELDLVESELGLARREEIEN